MFRRHWGQYTIVVYLRTAAITCDRLGFPILKSLIPCGRSDTIAKYPDHDGHLLDISHSDENEDNSCANTHPKLSGASSGEGTTFGPLISTLVDLLRLRQPCLCTGSSLSILHPTPSLRLHSQSGVVQLPELVARKSPSSKLT